MSPNQVRHSLRHIHAKIRDQRLGRPAFEEIIFEINDGRYDAQHIAAFLTVCAANALNSDEIFNLTKAMVGSGEVLDWPETIILDKHCVGGLPGNRTTPILVSIVAAAGLTIPKTSSRAITSAAGTADTMEVFCPVDLSLKEMRRVVERVGGCVVWGGNVGLSPVDDELVSVARALEFDGHEQLVASVLSKKIAAGASHVVIDMPVGPTAKIADHDEAQELSDLLCEAARGFGLRIVVMRSDGAQPVGDGIGPALEARDVQAVLRGQANAPKDLKTRALSLSAELLEIGHKAKVGEGLAVATEILNSGRAWEKFQAICDEQGGMRDIGVAKYTHPILAAKTGIVSEMDNRMISKLAKMTGAPEDNAAGLDLHVAVGQDVYMDQPIFTLHSNSQSRLSETLEMVEIGLPAIGVMDIEERMRCYK